MPLYLRRFFKFIMTVFDYDGIRGVLVTSFYELLVSGLRVSYADVLEKVEGKECDKPSSSNYYGTLKKVVPEVIKELEVYGYIINNVREGRNTYYSYDGIDPDPLKNIREAAHILRLKDVIEQNISLKRAVSITYRPFDKEEQKLVFHPHLVRLYNNRWFAFGVSERADKPTPMRITIGIDRIVGDVEIAKGDHNYIAQEDGEYDYLKEVVGVTLTKDAKLEDVVLRTYDRYTFGRLVHKPLHHSQRVTENFDSTNSDSGFGEVTLKVKPNKELVGQILSYGSLLEVIEPEALRKSVADEIMAMNDRYK